MMAATLPAPTIPDLTADNTIDLDKLGNADLHTWVNYPGIAEGDEFWPAWWGCTALGEAVDDFNELVQIGPGELKPEGMPVYISNDRLKALDQGWVFYSYKSEPGLEESLRRFFYVGKRSSTTSLLPVPQFKESHALALDPGSIGDGGTTIVMAPYQAMSAGDKVTLTVDRYFEEDFPWDSITRTKELVKDDVGKPVQWPPIPKSEFEIIVDGFAHLNYRIDYATGIESSVSAIQTVHIINPPDTLLPPIEIKGFAGGDELDPDVFPDGITLTIKLYPGIQIGDDVVVYASGNSHEIKMVRVDASTMDSQSLEVVLDYAWLSANSGADVSLMYQHARSGNAGTSQPLLLALRKPLILPLPIVETATPDSDLPENNKGYLLANRITGGVYIKLPDDLDIGVAKVQMHWKGYGSTGSHIADPMVGNARRFQIPPSAIPANMGKRLDVFYKVTPPGKDSRVFDLEIKDMTSGWPTVQIKSPPSSGNRVSLAAAKDGVVFKLASWTYMRPGQRVNIIVEGALLTGGREIFELRTGAAEVVSEDEYYGDELLATLPQSFLIKLMRNVQFDVKVSTSFDDGNTYKVFPPLNPTLID